MGPLLFSIYINNISDVCSLSPLTHCVLYADDVLLYRSILQSEDFFAVQSAITTFEVWSVDHFLQLNPAKCKFMVLSKKGLPIRYAPTLYLNEILLEEVEEYKHLGVLINRNLSWSNHAKRQER